MAEIRGDDDFIRLSISGERFLLRKEKLLRLSQESRDELLPRFSSLNQDSRVCLSQMFFPEENLYYFDRSPEIFQCIADYYRTDNLHRPRNICCKQFLDELDFWEISRNKLSACCIDETGLSERENGEEQNCLAKSQNNRQRRFGQDNVIRDGFSGLCCETFRRKAWAFLEFPTSSVFAKGAVQQIAKSF